MQIDLGCQGALRPGVHRSRSSGHLLQICQALSRDKMRNILFVTVTLKVVFVRKKLAFTANLMYCRHITPTITPKRIRLMVLVFLLTIAGSCFTLLFADGPCTDCQLGLCARARVDAGARGAYACYVLSNADDLSCGCAI